MLLDTVMTMGGISPQSQEDLDCIQAFLDMGAEWLNRERVEFQAWFRWMFRTMTNPKQKIESSDDAMIMAIYRETYYRKGGRASDVEEAMNGEDWIGIET